jgi:hypothetical protein
VWRLDLFDCYIDLGNIDEFGAFVLSETLKFWKYYVKSVAGDCCSFKICPSENGIVAVSKFVPVKMEFEIRAYAIAMSLTTCGGSAVWPHGNRVSMFVVISS